IHIFSCPNWCNVCYDSMAREHRLPLHICRLCSNVESNHASCCFHSWCISWTRSDELQDASDNVGYQFWGTGSVLWGNKYKLDWCRLPNGRCSWRSFAANIYGDFCETEGTQTKSYLCLYYVSPCSALCLLIPWIFLERPKMDAQGTWSFKPLILMLNSLCTFALNLSVFLVISHTSALTIRVAGVVKDWVVVLLSALLFADTKLTLINLLGYAIAIAGVAAYNNHKLKKEASCVSSDEPAQSIPLVSTSTSNQ
ncbi:putative sugar phosphate/phosphate translocator, partial [Sesamum angolense]